MMAKVGDVESKKFDIIAAAVSQRRAASRIEDAMLRFQAIESTRCEKRLLDSSARDKAQPNL